MKKAVRTQFDRFISENMKQQTDPAVSSIRISNFSVRNRNRIKKCAARTNNTNLWEHFLAITFYAIAKDI